MDTQEAEEIERDGMTYIVRVHYDHDTSPGEYERDCYSPEGIEAWRRDEWWFVGIEVHSTLEPGTSASLWGLEYGTSPDWPGRDLDLKYYMTQSEGTVTDTDGVCRDSGSVVDNLVYEVNAMLAKLRDALTAAPLPASA